jgi:predicted transcriptional regulator
MIEWQGWVDPFLSEVEDPLEELILPARLLMRLKETHPRYAQMVARNLNEMARYIPELAGGFSKHVKELAKAKVISVENLEIRIQSFSAVLFSTLSHQLLNPKAKTKEADIALEVAMALLCISPAKAKKLARKKLPRYTTVIQ